MKKLSASSRAFVAVALLFALTGCVTFKAPIVHNPRYDAPLDPAASKHNNGGDGGQFIGEVNSNSPTLK
jgi:hypothetical protein